MTWLGPALDPDQQDLAGMLDALATDRGHLRDEDSDAARDLVATLAELGIWTLGVPEAAGGGGADHVMTTVALERLGRHWPSVGWAAVQAHAAAGLLAGIPDLADELASVHAGTGAIAVVDARAEHVRLDWVEDRLGGDVARVDVASQEPALLILTGARSALFVRAEHLSSRPVRTTGLDGGLSRELDVDVPRDHLVVLHHVDADAARRTLLLGVGALAVGVAAAAADGAHEYARHRQQFGGALVEIPTVRASLRSQRARVSAALAAVMAGADGLHQAHALAELACESAIEVTASALQSHGGYGYLDEYDAGTRLRDAVSPARRRSPAPRRSGSGSAAGGRRAGRPPTFPGERMTATTTSTPVGLADAIAGQSTPVDDATVEQWRRDGWWENRTIRSLLTETAARHPDRLSLVGRRSDGTRPTRTYAELDASAHRAANALASLGVGHGDAVVVMLPNWIEYAEIVLGINEIGATYAGVPVADGPLQAAPILRRSRAKVLVVPRRWRSNENLELARQLRRDIPTLEHVVVVVDDDGGGLGESEHQWSRLQFRSRARRPRAAPRPALLPRFHLGHHR